MELLRITRARDRLTCSPPAAPVDPSTLVGTWINYLPSTRGIHRVVVDGAPGRLTVRIFGAGEPEPVDWGAVPLDAFAGDVASVEAVACKAVYEFAASRTALLCYLNKRLLVVDAYTTFHDGSGRASCFSRDHFYLQ